MSEFTVNLPKLGESIMSATIVQWFKKPGDTVALDEPLLEVATDKVNSEIPSPTKGVLVKVLASVDEELDVGAPLAVIATGEAIAIESVPKEQTNVTTQMDDTSMNEYYSPAVLRIAQEKGISVEELSKMHGSGAGGRITRKDLENYSTHPQIPKFSGEVEEIKLSGMRKGIADAMTKSYSQIPHATLIGDVDVTDLLAHIAKEKDSFQKEHGVKLTITSYITQAIAKAAKEFPMFNASLYGDTIVAKKFVNVGIAVSLEKGLMVPVIKNCHEKSLVDISKAVAELADKARNDSLKPDDVQEGTITMTNFGMGGTHIGIPIIRYPESAIVGVGAIERKVVALDDEKTAIRKRVHISVTFDHRLIDGMDGCKFLASLKNHLENFS